MADKLVRPTNSSSQLTSPLTSAPLTALIRNVGVSHMRKIGSEVSATAIHSPRGRCSTPVPSRHTRPGTIRFQPMTSLPRNPVSTPVWETAAVRTTSTVVQPSHRRSSGSPNSEPPAPLNTMHAARAVARSEKSGSTATAIA